MNNLIKKGLIILGILILFLMLIRIISPVEIDDIHPNIPCQELEKYNPDILWIIPLYNGIGISENQEWCEKIKNLNKTLGMHGIYHSYEEFLQYQDKESLNKGIIEFEECFGYKPELFKAPQLKITPENKILIKEMGLELRGKITQTTHKVYHCNNQGKFHNFLTEIF